jgi:hypothetical protein
MSPKSKLFFNGKVFHRIEGVEFCNESHIYANGDNRLIIDDQGRILHQAKRNDLEEIKFFRLKGGGERKRKRFSNNRADFVKKGEGEPKKVRPLQNKEG